MRRPALPIRTSDTTDPTVIEARDVATTGLVLEALTSGRLALLGMAKLSAHMRLYDAPYPERRIATEGRGQMVVLIDLVDAMDEADLRVMDLRADGPIVNARFTISGELVDPFGCFEAGERVAAAASATFRYDTYGLVVEQWMELDLQRAAVAGRSRVGVESQR